jgi:hypothetical protein
MRTNVRGAVVLVAGLVLGSPARVRADGYTGGMIYGVLVGTPIGMAATGGAIAGRLSTADGGRPSTAVTTYAVGAGVVSSLWGSLLLYQATRMNDNQHLAYLPGAFDLIAGLSAITITLVRNAQPRSLTSTARS